MAKFIAVADTEANTLEVSVDGVVQTDVNGVSFNMYVNYEGETDVSAVVYSKTKSNGVHKEVRICAEQGPSDSVKREALAYFQKAVK